MTIVFPALAFLLLFLIFESARGDWRRSFLMAGLFWAFFLVVCVEVLSIFSLLAPGPMATLWAVFGVTLIFVLIQKERYRSLFSLKYGANTPLGIDGWLFIGGMGFLFVALLITALWAPPNSWDAMTYHLPRVEQWIQNQTVRHYPAHNMRQLYMQPFAEYLVLLTVLLTSGDYLANIPQLFAWAGVGVAVSLIARSLSLPVRGQAMAALFAVTIPTGVIEATGAKNDCLLSFMIALFVWFGLSWKEEPDNMKKTMLAGLALGLALFTKGTAYVVCLPFIVWFGVAGFRALKIKVALPVVVVAITAIAPNIGLYARNIELFDHPLGTMAAETPQLTPASQIYTPAAIASTAVRSAALHLGSPFLSINEGITTVVRFIHDSFLGISPDDLATTRLFTFYIPPKHPLAMYELDTGAPFHLLLSWVVIGLLVSFLRRRGSYHPVLAYSLCVSGALLLIFALFKWTPQNARYHLPVFVLFAPLFGLVFSSLKKPATLLALALLWIGALLGATMNQTRPLIPAPDGMWRSFTPYATPQIAAEYNKLVLPLAPRRRLYYAEQPFRQRPYEMMATAIYQSGCRNVGFVSDHHNDPIAGWTMEYQFWVMWRSMPQTITMRNVLVKNISADLELPSPTPPCALLYIYGLNAGYSPNPFVAVDGKPLTYQGVTYERAFTQPIGGVYFPQKKTISGEVHP